VILLGRNVPSARIAWVSELEAKGASVCVAAVDVGDEQSWGAFMASHEESGRPPIRGVFHAAGTLHPKRLMDLGMTDLQEVFRSKIAGTLHLHNAFAQRELDHFVLFSSAPPRLGALGQNLGAYNAANTFLDAMAHYRRSRGLSAVTLNWGPWSEVGLHTVETGARSNLERLAEFGLHGISNEKGVEILGHALSRGDTQSWAIHANWTRLFENDFMVAAKPFFSLLAVASGLREESEQVRRKQDEFLSSMRALTPKARRQRLERHLRGLVVQVMKLDGASADWRRGLFDMGMDSLMALELKTKLQNEVGISIPATLAFDYPTVDAIVGYLEGLLFSKPSAQQDQATDSGQLSTPSLDEAELDAFSEAELEAALLEKIALL
jgi:acyl carrier protein/NAD(P)-dependent dehydrogenase (short-subunit alcohol dehydrogenase family)